MRVLRWFLRIIGWSGDAHFVLFTLGGSTIVAGIVAWVISALGAAPLPITILLTFGAFLLSLGVIGQMVRRYVPLSVVEGRVSAPTEPPPDLPPMGDLALPYFRGRSVRIADLAAEDPVLADKTFEDCYIYGPGVLTLLNDVQLSRCTFAVAVIEDMLFEIPPVDRRMVGPIGLRHVKFIHCTFRGVGWLGSAEVLNMITENTQPASDA